MSKNETVTIIIKECNIGGKTTLLELVYYKLKEHFHTMKKYNNCSISERDEYNSAIEKIDDFWKKYKTVVQYLMRDQSSYNLDYEFVDHFDFNYKKEYMKNDLNKLIDDIFKQKVLFLFLVQDKKKYIGDSTESAETKECKEYKEYKEYKEFIEKYLESKLSITDDDERGSNNEKDLNYSFKLQEVK